MALGSASQHEQKHKHANKLWEDWDPDQVCALEPICSFVQMQYGKFGSIFFFFFVFYKEIKP